MRQSLVVLARADADPADGLLAVVSDQARRAALLRVLDGSGLHDLAMARLAAAREVEATDPEVRAPAPLGVAALLEELGQVGKAVRGEGPDVEGHVGDRTW